MTHQGRAAGETRAEHTHRNTGGFFGNCPACIAAVTEVPAAPAATLDVWDVATALHDTAPLGHNLGEGSQRAICNSIEAHADRAERIVAALAPSAGSAEGPAVPDSRKVASDPDSPQAWALWQVGAITVKDDSDTICTLIVGDINSVARRLSALSKSRPIPRSTEQPSHPAASSIGEAE